MSIFTPNCCFRPSLEFASAQIVFKRRSLSEVQLQFVKSESCDRYQFRLAHVPAPPAFVPNTSFSRVNSFDLYHEEMEFFSTEDIHTCMVNYAILSFEEKM